MWPHAYEGPPLVEVPCGCGCGEVAHVEAALLDPSDGRPWYRGDHGPMAGAPGLAYRVALDAVRGTP